MEGQAEHLDEEVNGVAGQVALRPAPVAVFDHEAVVSGQFEVAGGQLDELETAPLEQRNERGQPGGADLFAGPARLARLLDVKVPWQLEMADRERALKSQLRSDVPSAQKQLEEWEAESVRNLGLEFQ